MALGAQPAPAEHQLGVLALLHPARVLLLVVQLRFLVSRDVKRQIST
jgi:hypothetical protein